MGVGAVARRSAFRGELRGNVSLTVGERRVDEGSSGERRRDETGTD